MSVKPITLNEKTEKTFFDEAETSLKRAFELVTPSGSSSDDWTVTHDTPALNRNFVLFRASVTYEKELFEFSGDGHLGRADLPVESHLDAWASAAAAGDKALARFINPKAAMVSACRQPYGTTTVEEREVAVTRYSCSPCGASGRVHCRRCAGHGEMNCSYPLCYNGKTKCSWCGGSGKIPGGNNDWTDCGYCLYSLPRGWVSCSTCNGTAKITCGRCGGDGLDSCASCGGHGYSSVVQGYRIKRNAVLETKEKGPDAEIARQWIERGCLGAADREEVLRPFVGLELIEKGSEPEKGRFLIHVGCEYATGSFEAEYEGTKFRCIFLGMDEDRFFFTPFLDARLQKALDAIRSAGTSGPRELLSSLSDLHALVVELKRFMENRDLKAFTDAVGGRAKGAMSSELVTEVGSEFLGYFKRFERKVKTAAACRGIAMALVAAATAVALGVGPAVFKIHPDASVPLIILPGLLAGAYAQFWARKRLRKEDIGAKPKMGFTAASVTLMAMAMFWLVSNSGYTGVL